MIEKVILDYLGGALTAPVYMETPNPAPETYVTIERTGGGGSHIRTAMLAIQSHAPSLYKAAELSSAVVEAMRGAVTVKNVSRVDLNSEYNFTDTAKKEYRYQAVFDIIYHD